MAMIPLLVARIGRGDDVGDLEFIQEKVIAGDYFQVTGAINALNDTIEFIVPFGRTAFLIEAKIVITTHTTIALGQNTTTKQEVAAVLKIDDTPKDTTNIGTSAHSQVVSNISGDQQSTPAAAYGNIGNGKFNVLGLSLLGDGSKKIEIENILDDGFATATMSGYLV